MLPTLHFRLLTHFFGFKDMKRTRNPIAWRPTWASTSSKSFFFASMRWGSHYTPYSRKNSSLNSIHWFEQENLRSRLDHLACPWLGLHHHFYGVSMSSHASFSTAEQMLVFSFFLFFFIVLKYNFLKNVEESQVYFLNTYLYNRGFW